jgi:tRNA1(Val) A37 N6-methylase TrmN6
MALWCALEDAALEADGYELQPALAGLARRNAEHNGLDGRVQICEGDLRQYKTLLPASAYDAVIINPPYFPVDSGHPPSHPEKSIARHETALTLSDWTAAAAHALKDAGDLFAVYPAKRMVALLGALAASRIEPRMLQPVHPSGTKEAVQVLVRAVRGGRPGLSLLPALDGSTLR